MRTPLLSTTKPTSPSTTVRSAFLPRRWSGGTTTGMRLLANQNVNTTGGQVTQIFSGISASPLSNPTAGLTAYRLSFQVWENSLGPFPGGGAGSTQMTGAGVGARTTQAQFPGGSVDGLYFAASGDGNTNPDYRVYNAPGAPLTPTTGVYAAGTSTTAPVANDNLNPYYSSFGSQTPPAAQTALFPQQTGTTTVGSQAFGWHQWVIDRNGNIVTWTIDNVLIATADLSTHAGGAPVGDNVFFGQFDINTTTTDAAGRDLVDGIFDNITITTPVPEPSSFALAGLAIPALLRLRRRRKA